MTKEEENRTPADKALDERVSVGGSVHTNFVDQVQTLIKEEGITEEDRKKILENIFCPCCGGSGISYVLQLNDKT